MEEPKNALHGGEEQKNPIIEFFSNLVAAIQQQFLQKKNGAESESAVAVSQAEEPVKISPPVAAEDDNKTPTVVTFPKQSFAPLKLEAEADEGQKSTNPMILWQVYALGGILVARWAWMRWNESKGKKKPSDEPPPAHD